MLSTHIVAFVAACFVATAPAALGCTCWNNVPVQKSDPKYQNRAVFKAHVIQFLGRTGGITKRYSDRALAVVDERYWGLPWYWPKIVILDGGLMCGFPLVLGEEYLVVGHRTWYGALDISTCSGTHPLRDAQVDIRTLDGSRCAGPGGSLLGSVNSPAPSPDIALIFRDSNGKPYTGRTDRDGIYELRNLPPDRYTLDSRVSANRYAYMSAEVKEGMCAGGSVNLKPYSLTGRLAPGMGYGTITVVEAQENHTFWGETMPDGRFYFNNVPPGEYFLTAAHSETGTVYYPGVRERANASAIRVSAQPAGQSFDFIRTAAKPERAAETPMH